MKRRRRIPTPRPTHENAILVLALLSILVGKFGPHWLAAVFVWLLILYAVGTILYYVLTDVIVRHRRKQEAEHARLIRERARRDRTPEAGSDDGVVQ